MAPRHVRDIVKDSTEKWMAANKDDDDEYFNEMKAIGYMKEGGNFAMECCKICHRCELQSNEIVVFLQERKRKCNTAQRNTAECCSCIQGVTLNCLLN